MAESLPSRPDESPQPPTDPKPARAEHSLAYRKWRVFLWRMKRSPASLAAISAISFLGQFLSPNIAQAGPAESKGSSQLSRAKESARHHVRDLLESSSDGDDGDSSDGNGMDNNPPPRPSTGVLSIQPPREGGDPPENLERIELDLTSFLRSEALRLQPDHDMLDDLTFETEDRLPLDRAWDAVGNLVENSVDRADAFWRQQRGDIMRNYQEPEVRSEEIDLWRVFQREMTQFLTPRRVKLSSRGLTLVNEWEWNNQFELSVRTRFRADRAFLDSIRMQAEFRQQIMEGMLRIVAQYRFRPQDLDTGFVMARYDYAWTQQCHGFISAQANLDGSASFEVGFTITFGGPDQEPNPERYRSSRRSAGARARAKLEPERVLSRVARRAARNAEPPLE